MNRITLIGNLGQDPELAYTAKEEPVAKFTLATTEKWGDGKSKTEWHRIVVWGKQAVICHEYLKKGQKAAIEGRIQSREWEGRDGKKNVTVEVIASNIEFLSRGDAKPLSAPEQIPLSEPMAGLSNEEIPF